MTHNPPMNTDAQTAALRLLFGRRLWAVRYAEQSNILKMKPTYKNINTFMETKKARIKHMPRLPLIIHWISSPSMEDSLTILDLKVGYLLDNFLKGGEGKLNQWLLTDDVNFCTLTAERYIADYLRSKNSNIDDNLGPKGVDGFFY